MNTITDKKIAIQVSKLLLQVKAVTLNTQKPYRYVSGMLAPIYTDNRLLMSYPEVWEKVIDYYIQVMKKASRLRKVEVLSGTALAAIPHAAALAMKLKIPMVYVRSAKKDHGKENLIEGTFKRGSHVLIVEDLITTGKSSLANIAAIRALGGIVSDCLAITTSTKHAFVETFKEARVRLLTLTNVDTTVETAAKEGYITKKQQPIVEAFLKDSPGWGKKMGFE